MLELKSECLKFIEPGVITKRIILSVAHKFINPIGSTSPTALWPKILLQRNWEYKISWDEELPEDIKKNPVDKELYHQSALKIPGCLAAGLVGAISWTLQYFCNSSKDTYGTAIYLRGESSD